MLAYVAGPINAEGVAMSNWRHLVSIDIQALGVTCYRPDLGFMCRPALDPGDVGQRIIVANEQILAISDVVIADLDFRSVGTVREVQLAVSLGVPVVARRPGGPTNSPYTRDTRIEWVETVDEAIAVVKKLLKAPNKNPANLDNSTTTLPRPALSVPPLLISLTSEATPPQRAYPTSAGLDLVVSKTIIIGPDDFTLVPTGVSVAIPVGYVGILRGRSSAWFNRRLLIFEGTIDAEYRGELFIGAKNLLPVEHRVDKGDRLAQLLIIPISTPQVVIVDKLDETARGAGGFGSTGR